MKVPRRIEMPDDSNVARLQRAVKRRESAERELKAAVVAASESGGSIRAIAEITGLGTNTVQRWLSKKP